MAEKLSWWDRRFRLSSRLSAGRQEQALNALDHPSPRPRILLYIRVPRHPRRHCPLPKRICPLLRKSRPDDHHIMGIDSRRRKNACPELRELPVERLCLLRRIRLPGIARYHHKPAVRRRLDRGRRRFDRGHRRLNRGRRGWNHQHRPCYIRLHRRRRLWRRILRASQHE
jgi:hypothetical protein